MHSKTEIRNRPRKGTAQKHNFLLHILEGRYFRIDHSGRLSCFVSCSCHCTQERQTKVIWWQGGKHHSKKMMPVNWFWRLTSFLWVIHFYVVKQLICCKYDTKIYNNKILSSIGWWFKSIDLIIWNVGMIIHSKKIKVNYIDTSAVFDKVIYYSSRKPIYTIKPINFNWHH